jgi:hypothetical protein
MSEQFQNPIKMYTYTPMIMILIGSVVNHRVHAYYQCLSQSKLLVSAKFALSLVKLFVNKHHSKMSSRHYVWLKILNINLLQINQTHQINFVMKFKLSLILFSRQNLFLDIILIFIPNTLPNNFHFILKKHTYFRRISTLCFPD